MTLNQFLSTLLSTSIQITLKDAQGEELGIFKAGSYAILEDTLESKIIASWQVFNANSIIVTLQAED